MLLTLAITPNVEKRKKLVYQPTIFQIYRWLVLYCIISCFGHKPKRSSNVPTHTPISFPISIIFLFKRWLVLYIETLVTRLLASHSSEAQWLTIRYTRWLVQLKPQLRYSFLGMEDARSSSVLIFGFSFVFTRRDFSDMNYLGIIGSSRSRRARPYFSTWQNAVLGTSFPTPGAPFLPKMSYFQSRGPVCKLWQAPYRDSLSIWNFLPDIYSYLTLPISFLQKFYLTKIFLWEILPYQNFLFRNAKKFYHY